MAPIGRPAGNSVDVTHPSGGVSFLGVRLPHGRKDRGATRP